MIANFLYNPTYTRAERFFTAKVLEMTYAKTLDSYRARLHNPHSAIIELNQVLTDFNQKKIKHFDKTVKPVCNEVIRFLKGDHYLDFEYINQSYFLDMLEKVEEKNYHELWHAIRVLVKVNNDYGTKLFKEAAREIDRLNLTSFEIYKLEKLSSLTNFIVSELVGFGISKGYLYQAVSKCFSNKMTNPFATSFRDLATLLTREPELFQIVFKITNHSDLVRRIDIKSEALLTEESINELSTINDKSAIFFSKRKISDYFLRFEVSGKDFLSVIDHARRQLFNILDIMNLGYPDKNFSYYKRCLVIGTRKRNLTSTHPLLFNTDGSYLNSEIHYLRFLNQIKAIRENDRLQKETKQKLISAYRYLRLGRDAIELEQKFINYWIGLEYLFSNYDISDSTIVRMKEGFVNAHAITYIKRNLHEFHKDIKRMKLDKQVPNYGDTLAYLTCQETYEYIIKTYQDSYPLMAFRAYKLKQNILSKDKLKQKIKKHRENLEWQLIRCYRIRNEVVHDAAIHMNIEAITSNLKYYLTFILNSIIDFLATPQIDMNSDGQVSIEDYLILQKLKFKSLEKFDFDIEKIMQEKSVAELFVY